MTKRVDARPRAEGALRPVVLRDRRRRRVQQRVRREPAPARVELPDGDAIEGVTAIVQNTTPYTYFAQAPDRARRGRRARRRHARRRRAAPRLAARHADGDVAGALLRARGSSSTAASRASPACRGDDPLARRARAAAAGRRRLPRRAVRDRAARRSRRAARRLLIAVPALAPPLAEPASLAEPPTLAGLSRLPRRQCVEPARGRAAGRAQQRGADPLHRPRRRLPRRLRLGPVGRRADRDPVHRRRRRASRACRSASTTPTSPTAARTRSRRTRRSRAAATPTATATCSSSTRRPASSTSCSTRTPSTPAVRWHAGQRRDMGPALQPAAAAGLDLRRRRRPADPPRPRALRRGGARARSATRCASPRRARARRSCGRRGTRPAHRPPVAAADGAARAPEALGRACAVCRARRRIVAPAMKRYGLMLADNGSPWYVSGAPDPRWDNDQLHALDRLSGRDFEVVDRPRAALTRVTARIWPGQRAVVACPGRSDPAAAARRRCRRRGVCTAALPSSDGGAYRDCATRRARGSRCGRSPFEARRRTREREHAYRVRTRGSLTSTASSQYSTRSTPSARSRPQQPEHVALVLRPRDEVVVVRVDDDAIAQRHALAERRSCRCRAAAAVRCRRRRRTSRRGARRRPRAPAAVAATARACARASRTIQAVPSTATEDRQRIV